MRKRSVIFVICMTLVCLSAGGCSSYSYESGIEIFRPGTYTVTVEGYGGSVTVAVTFSKSRVSKVEVLEHSETAGTGDAAMKAVADVITGDQSFGVDIVSGATVSSWVIVEAVSRAAIEAGADIQVLTMPPQEPEVLDEMYGPPYAPGIYYGTAYGFSGEIMVIVEVDEDSIISITTESSGETAGIGSNALSLMPDRIKESGSPEVDGISGATITSNAVKDAVAQALLQAKAG